ncbi:MAG: Wzz/FepE/Etk N-terminal domain-containing protein [Collinsella stercoris]|uniref:Wzz/FepE/Etk N-terminal domain-containing protein n=1 Tax=Collinsella stercoris TaxID=147206 RepID=UPI0039911769
MTLLELLDLMKKRIKLVIGLPIVCALLIGAYSFMFMPDTYTATTSMYVLTNQEQSAGNLSTDLSASQMVANDVTTLLNSNRVRKATADDLGLKSLKDFEIEVTSATTSV